MNVGLTLTDVMALSPLWILLSGALAVLLVESLAPLSSKKYTFILTALTLILALFAVYQAPSIANPFLTNWIRFDSLAHFFTLFFLSIGLSVTLLSASFFRLHEATHGEYFFLLLAALFGLILIGAAADFLTLFLGIETLSIALYVLCTYMKKWEISHEASIKYFLTGSLAAAFFLYGVAFIYGAVGTTRFEALLPAYQHITTTSEQVLFLSGVALVTLGLAFEAALFPVHLWAPDVYAGAPTPVTAFMAVGTKAGAFAAFIRIFLDALPHFDPFWNRGMEVLAYLTLIYANIVILRQVQLRRFFAYSGIAHAGFLLMPLIAGSPEAFDAIAFYLIIYTVATVGCFAVLAFLDQHKSGPTLLDLQGLFYRAPFLASVLTLCLLTLAGLPPTAGFLAKFYVFKIAFQAGYVGLVLVGLVTTVLSAYYYVRLIAALFSQESEERETLFISWPAALVGGVACVVLVALSLYPSLVDYTSLR